MIRFLRALWGDLSETELKKFSVLGAMMMLVIGNYWMLRVTKDGLFDQLVGYRQWQPVAKWMSIIVMIVAVLGYSKLLDIFKKSKLIYLFCSFYGLAFIVLSFLIANPGIIAVGSSSVLYPLVSWIPSKVPGGGIGWVAYLLLESYGSLLIALFYSFVASVMTTGSAKKRVRYACRYYTGWNRDWCNIYRNICSKIGDSYDVYHWWYRYLVSPIDCNLLSFTVSRKR